MARPIWNGIISFGLLNIPISLQSAERRVDLHFRMIDSRNQTPIRYERVNAETGEEVPWKDIVQAFEYKKGNYVVLSKQEIAGAAPHGKESIDIEAFVDRDEISPMFYEKPYYLVPGKKAEKGYALLRAILKKTRRAGIGYVVIRTRRYLAAVLVEGEALILNLLRFHQEVVGADNFIFPSDNLSELHISARETEMATQLVDSMTVPWQVEGYKDDYRDQLTKLVEQRLAKKQGLIQEADDEEAAPEAATNVVDFMALLKQSLNNKQNKSATVRSAKAAGNKATPDKKATLTSKASVSKPKAKVSTKSEPRKKPAEEKKPARKTKKSG